jgi:hypothetical protein
MFLHSLLLELKKQKGVFYGLLVVILVGICGVGGFGVLTGKWSFYEAHTGILMLLIAGIPFFGVILGAMAGSSLRKEPVKSIEELLPVPPLKRVLAAYTASLAYYILIAFVSPLILASEDVMRSVYSTDTFGKISQFPNIWILLVLLHFHFLSFTFSYWTKNGVLGGGLALIIGSAELAPVMAGSVNVLDLTSYEVVPAFWTFFFTILILVNLSASLISFRTITKRLELGMNMGFVRGFILALALISAGLITVLTFYLLHLNYPL